MGDPLPPETDEPTLLAAALEHHQAGRLTEAERLYRAVLLQDPGQADARYKYQLRAIVAQLPPASTILLTIGEIDCRPDEGNLAAWRKSAGRPLDSIARDTVEGYLTHVAATIQPHGHQVIVAGIPAPSLPDTDSIGTAERVPLIRSCNALLRDAAPRRGFAFLDLYALTDSGQGIATGQWHLDRFHLRPDAFEEAFRNYYIPSDDGPN